MSGSIYYELALPRSCASITPRERIEELWSGVSRLPVLELTSVLAFADSACGPESTMAWGTPGDLLKLCASGHLTHPDTPDRMVSVDPLEVIGFVVWIGSRVEPLTLGLARYPETIPWRGGRLATGLAGWHWHAGCKVHYARVLGVDHFERCHRTVMAALDLAAELGFVVTRHDESADSGTNYGRAGPAPAKVTRIASAISSRS